MPSVPLAELKLLSKTKALKTLTSGDAHLELIGDAATISASLNQLRRHFNVFVYKVDAKTKAQLVVISPRR